MFCKKCGALLNDAAKVCPSCTHVAEAPPCPNGKRISIFTVVKNLLMLLGILAFFLYCVEAETGILAKFFFKEK